MFFSGDGAHQGTSERGRPGADLHQCKHRYAEQKWLCLVLYFKFDAHFCFLPFFLFIRSPDFDNNNNNNYNNNSRNTSNRVSHNNINSGNRNNGNRNNVGNNNNRNNANNNKLNIIDESFNEDTYSLFNKNNNVKLSGNSKKYFISIMPFWI